jgi:signal peptidase I
MAPTLTAGQHFTADNRVLRARPPALGDIVTFNPPLLDTAACANASQGPPGAQPCGVMGPGPSTQTFVKRVIGLPGDRIAIRGGQVVRNGIVEREPYIAACGAGEPACDLPKPITVPPGAYYMLGDNRGNSDDSRFFGPVPRAWIIGLVKR